MYEVYKLKYHVSDYISAQLMLGLGISELFLQIWNETGCFHGQIWRRTRICQNI